MILKYNFFIYASFYLHYLLNRDLQRLTSFNNLVSYPYNEKHPQKPNSPNAKYSPLPYPLALAPPLGRERKKEEEKNP